MKNRAGKHFFFLVSALTFATGCASRDGEDGKDQQPEGSDASAAQQSIVVYYANETPDSVTVASRLDRLDSLLSQAWQLVPAGPKQAQIREQVRKQQLFIKQDRADFPSQIAKDIRGLEKQICLNATYRGRTSLFVFTNKLARDGKFQFCMASALTAPLDTGSYPLALVESAVMSGKGASLWNAAFKDSPLVFAQALRAARDVVQAKVGRGEGSQDPGRLSFIAKSHFAVGKVVMSRHPLDNEDVAASSGSGTAFIQGIIAAEGALPELQNLGITTEELRDELKSLPFLLEILLFDHSNTLFDAAVGIALREAFPAIRGSIFTPPGQGAGYESLSWGNLPPAADFPSAMRQVLKAR